MNSFLSRFQSNIKGVLSGFDRIRFRGTLRFIANREGLSIWLSRVGVLYKDFASYATSLTDQIKETTNRVAENAGRPVVYLNSPSIRKEDRAREIANQDGIESGLVCVLSAVEPCITFTVGPNRQLKKLEIRRQVRQCLHYYFYLIDPFWGWLNVRL